VPLVRFLVYNISIIISGLKHADSVEDIFHDWNRMLQKSDVHINADINDVFWDISIDQAKVRTRRFSEVLDDMPFGDRPDIFQVKKTCIYI
jgi:hypothetical protein